MNRATTLTEDANADLRLLDVTECCELLRVSRWQLYKLMNSGRLPSLHIDRRRLVRARDLEAYLDNLTKQVS